MKKLVLVTALVSAALLAGCATPLNSAQKREMQFFNQKGYTIEEKNPAAAAGFYPVSTDGLNKRHSLMS